MRSRRHGDSPDQHARSAAASTPMMAANSLPLTPPRNRMPMRWRRSRRRRPGRAAAAAARRPAHHRGPIGRKPCARLLHVILLAHGEARGVKHAGHLHQFRRLQVEDVQRDPAPRAERAAADAGHQHDHQQHQADQERQRRQPLPAASSTPKKATSGGANATTSANRCRVRKWVGVKFGSAANRQAKSRPNKPSPRRAAPALRQPAATTKSIRSAPRPPARGGRSPPARQRRLPEPTRRGVAADAQASIAQLHRMAAPLLRASSRTAAANTSARCS